MDERRKSILTLRRITSEFLKGDLDFIKYYDVLSFELGSTFDPFDWTTEDLESELVEELELYLKFSGGEFGEHDDFIPKNKDWKYGESDVKYAWIDSTEYKELLKIEYSLIKLKRL
jgi:hypothetical protein